MIQKREIPAREWGTEKLLPLKQLARQSLPVSRSRATLYNWAVHGVETGGVVLHLASANIGGSIHSSVEAVNDFINDIARRSHKELVQRVTGNQPRQRRVNGME